jgi:methenyltetrahydromethanopterin cyclohydrolase
MYYTVEYDDEEALRKIVEQAPSRASKSYGKPFLQVFKRLTVTFTR